MSRIGRLPIPVPAGVKVDIKESDVVVTGPKGQMMRSFHPHMAIKLEDGAVVVERPSNHRYHRSLHGLTRALLANMVTGVTEGFKRELVIEGTGFRAALEGGGLVLRVGYSHPIKVVAPEGVNIEVDRSAVNITVSGMDKELVGEVAAKIREVKVPDAYKGRGIRYADEKVRIKPGKSGKAAG
ncbi:MAG: 50S ribosomal protein L6 [Chloroflexi bacterium]|nr:50S ribosomal protein L6 [Chloroflexota bacterium]